MYFRTNCLANFTFLHFKFIRGQNKVIFKVELDLKL